MLTLPRLRDNVALILGIILRRKEDLRTHCQTWLG